VKEEENEGEDESSDVRESTLSPRVNGIIYSITMVDTNQLQSPIYRLSPSLHPSSVPRNSTYREYCSSLRRRRKMARGKGR
jgi:hypothetical protein